MKSASYTLIKLHYVLVYAILGAHIPYIPLFLEERGMTPWQIGLFSGFQGIAVLLAPVVLTAVADRWLSNRVLMMLCYATTGIAFCWLSFVNDFSAANFYYACVLGVIYSLGLTSLIPMLDGLTFAANHEQLEASLTPPHYHQVRIWGTVGFILPSLILFFLMKLPHVSSVISIQLSAAIALLGILAGIWLPAFSATTTENSSSKFPTVSALRALIRSPLNVFVGALFLLLLSISSLGTFYSLYIVKLGAAEEWVGLIVNIGVFVEIFFMLNASRLLKLIGYRGIMLLGAGSMVARFVLLAAIPNLWVALLTQVFHGPMVLSLFLIPPMFLNSHSEKSYRNSIQGVYWLLCFGVTRIIGSSLSGYFADFNLAYSFWYGAIFSAAGFCVLLLGFFDPQSKNEIKTNQKDAITEDDQLPTAKAES